MLRSSVLLVLAAALAASSLWLTWGEKSVVYEECRLDLERQQSVCDVRAVRASYDPRVLRGEVAFWEVVDGDADRLGSERFRHAYDEPARGEASWWRSPVLPWARPALLAGVAAAPASVAAGWLLGRRPAWIPRASWAPLGAAVALGGGVLLALGGVALHALSWTASRVEPLRPTPGTWVLVAAGLAGVAGGLRMHVLLRDRAEGRTGASPLVPAASLYGLDGGAGGDAGDGTDGDAVAAGRGRVLRWPAGGALAVAAVVLLLLPLGLPLATKSITLRECVEDEARGSVCSERPLSVAYHAGHVRVSSADGSERLHALGAFQEAYAGPWWMGLGAVASGLGAAALLAGLALAADARPPLASRLRAVGAALLAGGFVLSVLGVAVQASGWVGAPAGRSHPAAGLWLGLGGVVALAAWRTRLRRSRSLGAVTTATTTSGVG